MAINVTDLTNATTGDDGTGVFDRLMVSVQNHVEEQYTAGRFKGADYAQVYLGALQATLSESIKYMSEIKHSEPGGTIDLQKQKLQEEIDLVIAQTAEVYQSISDAKDDTSRKNNLNTKVITKTEKETALLTSQNSELLLNGPIERTLKTEQTTAVTSGALDNTNKTNAEVALMNAQELEVTASTVRRDAESTEKVNLLIAQTTGFKVDAKQKLLKQMLEGYGINVTTEGVIPVNAPSIAAGPSIEAVANDIMDDLGSLVNV